MSRSVPRLGRSNLTARNTPISPAERPDSPTHGRLVALVEITQSVSLVPDAVSCGPVAAGAVEVGVAVS
jgi:hypothetical protein